MKTTFSRTFVTFFVILLAALLLVGISFQLLVRSFLTDRVLEDLKADSSAIAQVAAAYYQADLPVNRDLRTLLALVSEVSDADTVICDSSGNLLVCSDAPLGCAHQGMTITSKPYLQRILSQEHVVSSGVIEGLYPDARYVVSTAFREEGTENPLGIVIMSTPMAPTLAIMKRIADTYIFVSILAVVMAVVALVYYTRKSSTPLRHMAQVANAFGHGDLKARASIPDGAPQEIQALAIAFNNMARSLEKSETQRKEFVTNVSHELKTPMTTIGGYVDGILDGTVPPSRQQHYLQIVSDETRRLSRLVRSMLDISQLQEQGQIPDEKKTCFDVVACVGEVLVTFERQINAKKLDVQVALPEHPVMTVACRDYITQVVYNLVDNGVKFCPAGGTLGVQVQPGQNKIYVRISNDGQTIPADQLPLLFDRFHKLDKSRNQNRDGWGLGLYIVKTLICSHGEDISVSSTNGVTAFTFTLPFAN